MNTLDRSFWADLLQNPESVKELYEQIPELSGTDLLCLELSREGPSIKMRLNVEQWPDRPPKRWLPGSNRVTFHFSFWGVTDFIAKGLYSTMKVSIIVGGRSDKRLDVTVQNNATGENMSFEADFYRLDRITSYLSS